MYCWRINANKIDFERVELKIDEGETEEDDFEICNGNN